MPIVVPRVSRSPRRGPSRQFIPVQREGAADAPHSNSDAEELDRVISLSIFPDEQIEVVDDFVTVAALILFAQEASAPALPSLPAPTETTLLPDASYVPKAQRDSGSNPARSDLGGLAENTYQLKMAVARQFQISPGSIGGRAYRPYKSDHTTGHAIDIPGSGARGDSIAAWVIPQTPAYKVKYIIFNHRIWYPGRGWQPYTPSKQVISFSSDPYHERHVHVSTY
jgi:hypothetical protein